MEPSDLLDMPDEPPPGPDELRSIAARAGRLRWRAVSAGAAIALVVGGVVGYAVSNHSSGPETVTAAGSPTAPSANSPAGVAALPTSVSSGAGVTSGPANIVDGPKYTHLFSRTVGQIDIRAYQTTNRVPPALSEGCTGITSPGGLLVEASTPDAVDTAASLAFDTTAGEFAGGSIFGVREGDPVAVVIVHAGSGVAKVTATFTGTGTTDSMAPVSGWAVLGGALPASFSAVHGLPYAIATVESFGPTGSTLHKATVNYQDYSLGYTSTGTAPLTTTEPQSTCVCPASSIAANSAAIQCACPASSTAANSAGVQCACPLITPSVTAPAVPGSGAGTSSNFACPGPIVNPGKVGSSVGGGGATGSAGGGTVSSGSSSNTTVVYPSSPPASPPPTT